MRRKFDATEYARLLAEFLPKPIRSSRELRRVHKFTERFTTHRGATPAEQAILDLLVTLVEHFDPCPASGWDAQHAKHAKARDAKWKQELAARKEVKGRPARVA